MWLHLSFFLLCLALHATSGATVAIEFDSAIINFGQFAQEFGLLYQGPIGILDHIHLFTAANISNKRSHSDLFQFLKSAKRHTVYPVKWYEEQIPRRREKRTQVQAVSITDPLYPRQWHLHGAPKTHLNTEAAWARGFMGEGVRIAIVDDGIQTTHPDMKDNIQVSSSWNFNKGIQSPDPTYMKGSSGDWHGTASAGAAAARNDGTACGVGVAPHAELAGIAILQNNAEVGDAVEAQALSFMPQENHIYSNSWGPIKPGTGNHKNEKPGPLLAQAIQKTIATGRGGLGSIYVWAAGNDGSSRDNCNYDGYASMRYSILVGSTDPEGNPSSYSEPCSAMLAVAPGGLVSSGKIVTTDLLGSDGLDGTDCTQFSGTSASCPLAAGVVALALQANPNLSWIELQYIVIESSKKNNDHPSWVQNAAGFWHSNHMGFGLLDADRIVDAALRWKDNGIVLNEIQLNGSASDKPECFIEYDFFVHHVEIDVWTTESVTQTTIILTSPAGTTSVLATPHEDRLSQWDGWTFLSRVFHGESTKGVWKLEVTVNGNAKAPSKWNIRLYANASNHNNSNIRFRQVEDTETPDYFFLPTFVPFSLVVVFLIRWMWTKSSEKASTVVVSAV